LHVDSCEVRQGDFMKFATWAAVNKKKQSDLMAPGEPEGYSYGSGAEQHEVFGVASRPASAVTFFDAYAYCKGIGGRLPSSQEWQSTARGKEDRLYPWGLQPNATPWQVGRSKHPVKLTCGDFPATDTPEGVSDMAGNVK